MKVLVAGSRGILDFNIDELLSSIETKEIVSGGAIGVDKIGERWAKDHNIPIKIFLPDWKKYGRSAGHIRNQLMVDYCDYAIIIWDGKSPGTRGTIEKLKKRGIDYKLIVV